MEKQKHSICGLINLINQWADEKGILTNGTKEAQAEKTLEEAQELVSSVKDKNSYEIQDGIGDILVTLIIQANMQNTTIEKCLSLAYSTIKDRKGAMVDGVFVKEKGE